MQGSGPIAIANLHVARAAGSRPSLPNTRAGVPVQSGARRSVTDIPKASADTTTPVAHILSHVAVSAYRPVARLRSNTKISLSVLIEVSANADQGQAHLSPRWSQPALSLRHKDPHRGPLGQRSFQPPIRESLAGTLRADPILVTTCIIYYVYKYIPVITS